MSDIPTWRERAEAHPDHQSGMISEDMIRARMGEEIADLRAEIERTYALLKDPNVVAINMLRGIIGMPSVEQIRHIYQDRLSLPNVATVVGERDEARAEVERLRDVLEYIVNVCPAIDPDGDQAHERARKALEEKP